MKVRNTKNKANCVNFRDNGFPKKITISAGATVDIPSLINVSQIINQGDFNRGFFEIVEEVRLESKSDTKNKSTKKAKEEDSLEKVEKEVRNYTDKEE